jgi:large subunit ribosomal protein L1
MPDSQKADQAKTTDAAEPQTEAAETAEATDEKVAEKAPAKKPAAKKAASKKAAPKATGHVRTLEERGRGKKYLNALAQIDRENEYSVDEAIKLAKETSTVSFDPTLEVHLRLGVDPRQADQNIRGTVQLPAGTGKVRRVLAFVPQAQHAAAKKAGADFVSDEATIKKVKDGWTEFDVTVATPDQMGEVGKLGQALGPKGLMPNPKAGTVTDKPEEAIKAAKQGTIEFRLAKDATMHAGIGKLSFSEADLAKNLKTFYQAVAANKPTDFKGTYVHTVTIASTMGPGIRLSQASLAEAA